MLEEIVTVLTDRLKPILSKEVSVKKNKLYLDGSVFSVSKLKSLYFNHQLVEGTTYSQMMPTVRTDIVTRCYLCLKDHFAETLIGVADGDAVVGDQVDPDAYCYLMDSVTGDSLMLHVDTYKASTMHPEAWLSIAKPIYTEEELVPHICKFIYAPSVEEEVFKGSFDKSAITVVNRYVRPAWMLEDVPESSYVECPQEFLDLLRFIFKNEGDVKYFLAWLSLSFTGKNTCCLVMNGGKGIGKTLLANICMRLHGLGMNATTVPSSFFDGATFNGVLQNKTLLYLDEKEIGFKQHTLLKTFTNKHLMIELKGKEARQVESFCNFLISSNNLTDMYILPDDRRFSVLDLTDSPEHLATAWAGQERFTTLQRIADDESATDPVLVKLGNWLKYYCTVAHDESFMMEEPWKGNHFYNLAIESCSQWQKFIINYFLNEDMSDPDIAEWDYEAFKKGLTKNNNKKMTPNVDTVARFLSGFDFYGLGPIGEIATDSDGEISIAFNAKLSHSVKKYGLSDRSGDFIYRTKPATPITLGPKIVGEITEIEDDGLDCL